MALIGRFDGKLSDNLETELQLSPNSRFGIKWLRKDEKPSKYFKLNHNNIIVFDIEDGLDLQRVSSQSRKTTTETVYFYYLTACSYQNSSVNKTDFFQIGPVDDEMEAGRLLVMYSSLILKKSQDPNFDFKKEAKRVCEECVNFEIDIQKEYFDDNPEKFKKEMIKQKLWRQGSISSKLKIFQEYTILKNNEVLDHTQYAIPKD